MRYSYETYGTCTRKIEFDINGNVITNVTFLEVALVTWQLLLGL